MGAILLILLEMSVRMAVGRSILGRNGPFDADDEDELGLIGNVVGAFLLAETG